MELRIDLNAPPHMLLAALSMLSTAIAELHPDYAVESAPLPNGRSAELYFHNDGSADLGGVGSADIGAGKTVDITDDADSRVDERGVPFSVKFCAEAKEPFYASGPYKGQWKKGRGVDQALYDEWYARALPAESQQTQQTQVNTAAAFGGTGGTPSPSAFDAKPAPTDAGALMGWISEKQAADLLVQADIDTAYTMAQVSVMDLFPPNTPQVIAQRVGVLYQILSQKVGA